MSSSNLTSRLADRLAGVSESATLALNAAVQQMKAQGVDVVNLTAGEPDFAVHDAVKKAVIDAVHANKSKYTPTPGIPELRALIAERTNRQQPSITVKWNASDVIATNGGKQALFNAVMSVVNPGDEVIIPSPYWLSYPEMVKIAGGKAVFVQAPFAQGFKITAEQLRAAITPRTKLVIFNSPSNPTGAMYSREEFARIGQVLEQAPHVWAVSDEIYDVITLDKIPFTSFLEAAPQLRDRVITVNGLSKSAAMTGWRMGWSVAPESVTQGMATLQGQSTSGINALAQAAAIAALKLPESTFTAQAETFRKRRDCVLEILRRAPKLEISVPAGAFYVFLGVIAYLKAGEDSQAFAQRLLADARVALVPGTPFGAPDFLRLSFATDERTLTEGCERIVRKLSH